MNNDWLGLGGKIAVVTGAAGGMGRAITARLADDGFHVVALDVRDMPEAAALRDEKAITFRQVDVANRTDVEQVVSEIESALGTPTVLVNAAGILSRAPFLELSDAEFERVLRVNLRGTFVCCQTVARTMVRASQRGKIVNISSNSQVMASPSAAHYAASKGAVAALTRTMAFELAPHGINVNLICPGPILTDMNAAAFADPTYRAQRERTIPWGRLGQPADVAGAVAFLTSDASDFITGAALFIDGGQTLTSLV
jgi:NAD(P)-dependent dehydrogenase (short-subunit alcohol dehydrogenase family)